MDFTGREVKVEVTDGQLLRGYVQAVEDGSLKIGTREGIVTLKGSDISDLDVLPVANPPEKPESLPQQSGKAPNAKKKKKKPQPQKHSQKSSQKSFQQDQGWDGSTEEFDFDASNKRFDKKAEFARIASERPAASIKRNYAPNEMVTQAPPPRPSVPPAPAPGRIPTQDIALQQVPPPTSMPAPQPTQAAQQQPMLQLATPLQLAEIEGYMLGKGWQPQALAELAGRGILDVILAAIGYPISLSVFILAGNHRSGIRALVAGRLLAAKGATVTAVVPYNLSVPLDGYIAAFEAAGGHLIKTQQELKVRSQQTPPSIIIDALQGFDNAQPTPTDLQVAAWLVSWANSQPNALRLSVDTVSPGLMVSSLVSCGLPLPASIGQGQRFIVDIGIPATVMQQLNLGNLAIHFGSQSVVRV